MSTDISRVSEFYLACRENKIDVVQFLIEGMSKADIDRLEPNGSTALHVACFHGHHDIVKLLLQKGASSSTKNKYDFTAMEEAQSESIRALFQCRRDDIGFQRRQLEIIEWIRVGKNMDDQAKAIRKMLQRYYLRNKKRHRRNLIDMIDLGQYDGVEKIQAYFDEANQQNDPTFLIRAYTEDTEFYSRLNRALATVQDLNSRNLKQRQLLDFLQVICCHSALRKYEIRTTTYRGMRLAMEEFKQYQVGSKIMTKTLLSTSKNKEEALSFTIESEESVQQANDRISCLCIYQIRKPHTALDIQDLSVFKDEEEVLIIPYTAFEVMNIGTINTDHGSVATIELRQCRSDISTYAMITAGGGLVAATVASLIAFIQDENN